MESKIGSGSKTSIYFGVIVRHPSRVEDELGFVIHCHKIGDGEIEEAGCSDSKDDVVLETGSAEIRSPVIHFSTSKAVVGQKMFLVGGVGGYPNEKLEDKVHWCDDIIAKKNWQINRLNIPRDCCQLVAMGKFLYAFGSFSIYDYESGGDMEYNLSADQPWVECYNLDEDHETSSWTPIRDITPPIERNSLPWRLYWCVSNQPNIVYLFGFDAEEMNPEASPTKLYHFDLSAKTCVIHDAMFVQKLHHVIVRLGTVIDSSFNQTRFLALMHNKPAFYGDNYLCFALRDNIYYYDLKKTSWWAKPMAGLNKREGILPRCDGTLYDPVRHFQIHGLGKDTFCLIWTDAINKLLHCTNFVVSFGEDGTLTASRLSTTKKLKFRYSFNSKDEAYSFAIQHKELRA